MEDSLSNKVSSSLIWSFGATTIPQLVRMLVTIVLAKILVPEDFGLIAMAMAVISFVEILREGGLGQALIQEKAHAEDLANVAFWLQMAMSFFLTVLIWGFAPLIAGYMGTERLSAILRIISLAFLASPFSSVPSSLMMRHMDFKSIFHRDIIPMFVSGPCSVLLALLGYGVWSLVIGYLVDTYLRAMIFALKWRPKLKFRWHRNMIFFGLHIVCQRILVWVNGSLFLLFIGKYQGAATLGYVNMAISISLKPLSFMSIPLVQVLYPAFSQMVRKKQDVRATYLKVTSKILMIGTPLCTLLFVLSPLFVSVVLGIKWQESVPVVKILVICLAFGNIVMLNPEIYKALGMPAIVTKLMALKSLLFVPIFYFTAKHGLTAFLYAFLSSSIIFAIINTYVCSRVLRFSLKDFISVSKGGLAISGLLALFWKIEGYFVSPELLNTYSGLIAEIIILAGLYLLLLRIFERQFFDRLVELGKKQIWVRERKKNC